MNRSILFANDFPPITSGIATFFHRLWRHLPPDRTEICAPRAPGSAEIDADYPIAVHRLPLPLGESFLAKAAKTAIPPVWALQRMLDRTPNRLHCGQVFSSGLLGLACRRWFGLPYVVYVYGSETVRLGGTGRSRDLMLAILSEADTVVTNSDSTTREFADFGVARDRLLRVYPGVDPRVFVPAPPDPAWVERLGLDGKRVLLTVARLDQRKGHDLVIRALARLPDDVVYLVPSKGREEDRLKSLVDELGLTNRVHFLGFVPDEDLPTLYNLCDIHVMPNRVTEGTQLEGDIEGFGISFVEAGSCGKPVVGGRSGGAMESVQDGRTGLLVDPTSEDELVDAIGSILDDADRAAEMGRLARARVEQELDWRILARQVEQIL